MTDYVKSTNFASKDALASGNPLKIVKGTEIDTEFNSIATAVATKADLNSPTLVTPNIGTPSAGVLTNATGLPLTTGVTGTLLVANGGTGATSITAGALVKGNGTTAFTAATSAEIATALGTTAVTNATNATNATNVVSGGTIASNVTATTQTNGDNTTKVATTAHVYGMGIGWGQTWQSTSNGTLTRSAGTTYTNTTGKPILVAASFTGAQSQSATLVVGGVSVCTTGILGSNVGWYGNVTGVVPAGATYYISVSGASLSYWSELR